MGAWGHGYFEDDSALDFMADVEDSDDPKQVIRRAFETASQAEYLESDEGCAVIVGATYVDGQINGTKFSPAGDHEPFDVDTFTKRNPGVDLSDLRTLAVEALNKVLADNSELNELWAENDEDYPVWKQGVEQLLQRLKF